MLRLSIKSSTLTLNPLLVNSARGNGRNQQYVQFILREAQTPILTVQTPV